MTNNKFVIRTNKNKIFECEAETVSDALDDYVEKALGFNKKFKTDSSSWNIFNSAVKSNSTKIALINGLCKYPADTIKDIIIKSWDCLVGVSDNDIIYEISADCTYAYVKDGTKTSGEVSIATSYCGLPVTCIGKEAFIDNTKITKISIPEGITIIKEQAFKNCSGLLAIEMPETLKTIENCAFEGCERLQSIKIPDAVINLGAAAYKNCFNLESVSLSSNIKSIEQAVFACCYYISDIKIPFGVTSIGSEAFYDCRGLGSVVIPSSVTTIGNNAFDFCSGLETIYYGGSETRWKTITVGEQNSALDNATIYYNH